MEAKDEGKLEQAITSIVDLLEDYGPIPEEVMQRLMAESDMEQLKKWLKLAAKADSMQAFADNM